MAVKLAQLAIEVKTTSLKEAQKELRKLNDEAQAIPATVQSVIDALDKIKPNIEINITNKASEDIKKVKRSIEALSDDVELNLYIGNIKEIRYEILGLKGKSVAITLSLNKGAINKIKRSIENIKGLTIEVILGLKEQTVIDIKAKLKELSKEVKIRLSVNNVRVIKTLGTIKKKVDAFRGRVSIPIEITISDVNKKLAILTSKLKAIVKVRTVKIKTIANLFALNKYITRLNQIKDKTVSVFTVINDSEIKSLVSSLSKLKRDYLITIKVNVIPFNTSLLDRLDRYNRTIDARLNVSVNGLHDLERANQSLSSFSTNANQAGESAKGFGAIIAGVVTGGILVLTNSFIENTKELQRNIALYNVSAETMQVYQQAADSVIKGGFDLADTFKDINDKLGDLIATGGGEAKDIFERLGLSIDNLRDKNPVQVLEAIVDKMEDLGNVTQQEKVFLLEALANDASKLLPLLENNREVLRAFQEQASKNYTLLSSDQLVVMEQAALAITDAKMAAVGLGTQLGVVGSQLLETISEMLAPLFRDLSGWLHDVENSTLAVNIALGALGAVAVPVFAMIAGAIITAATALIAFSLTPIGALITSITLAIGALITFRNETISIGNTTATVGSYVQATYQVIKERIEGLIAPLINAGVFIGMLGKKSEESAVKLSRVGNIIFNLGKLTSLTFKQMILIVRHFVANAGNSFSIFKLQAYQKVLEVKQAFQKVFSEIRLIIAGAVTASKLAISSIYEKLSKAPAWLVSEKKMQAFHRASIKKRISGYEVLRKAKEKVRKVKLSNRSEITQNIVNIKKYESAIASSAKKTVQAVLAIDRQIVDIVKNGTDGILTDIGKRAENISWTKSFNKDVKEMELALTKTSGASAKLNEGIAKFTPPVDSAKKKAGELKDKLDVLAKSKQELTKVFSEGVASLEREKFALSATKSELFKYDLENKRVGESKLKLSETQVSYLTGLRDEIDKLAEAKKKTAELSESKKQLNILYNSSLEGLKREKFAINASVIELYKYDLEHKKVGASKLKLNEAQIKVLVNEKAESIQLSENKKKAEQYTKTVKTLVQSYKDKSRAVQLNLIEEKKGYLARVKVELQDKKLNKTVIAGILADAKKTASLKLKLKQLKKVNTKVKQLNDSNKKALQTTKLQLIELKKGALARKNEELLIAGVDKATREKILADLKEVEVLKEKAKLLQSYLDKLDSLNKIIDDNNILLNSGADALKEHAYAIEFGNVARAKEIIKRERIIELQNLQLEAVKQYETVVSDVLKGNIKSLDELGSALIKAFDNGKLDRSLNNLSKKIVSALSTGNFSGIGSGILDIFKPTEGLSSWGQGLEAFGTGASLAGSLGANKMEQLGAGIGSAVGTAALGALGGAIGSVTGATWGRILGGLFEKGSVKAQFENKSTPTQYNDWRSGWYNSSKRAQGVDFTRTSDFGQFGLLGDGASKSIGRDDKEQVQNITAALDAIKNIDDAITSFLPESTITEIKGRLDKFNGDALNIEQLTLDRLSVITGAIPELSSLFKDMSLEEMVNQVDALVKVNAKAVPVFKGVGLKIGNELDSLNTLKGVNHLSELSGGIDSFTKNLENYGSVFNNLTLTQSSSVIDQIDGFNEALGLSGSSAIASSDQLYEYLNALDLNTEAGREQGAVLLANTDLLNRVTNSINDIVPSFYNLSLGLGSTRLEVTETVLRLADMSGGLDKLKTNLSTFFNGFYSDSERNSLALGQSALAVQKWRDSLTDSQKKALDTNGFRKYVEGIDKKTEAEQRAFVSALEVAGSMSEVEKSGQSLEAIIDGLDSGMLNLAKTMADDSGTKKASNELIVLQSKASSASNALRGFNRELVKVVINKNKADVDNLTVTSQNNNINYADAPYQYVDNSVNNNNTDKQVELLEKLVQQNNEQAVKLDRVNLDKYDNDIDANYYADRDGRTITFP
jgi:hypothetical protein